MPADADLTALDSVVGVFGPEGNPSVTRRQHDAAQCHLARLAAVGWSKQTARALAALAELQLSDRDKRAVLGRPSGLRGRTLCAVVGDSKAVRCGIGRHVPCDGGWDGSAATTIVQSTDLGREVVRLLEEETT